jgi:hypothetical protein
MSTRRGVDVVLAGALVSVWGRFKREMEGQDMVKTGFLPIGRLENITADDTV